MLLNYHSLYIFTFKYLPACTCRASCIQEQWMQLPKADRKNDNFGRVLELGEVFLIIPCLIFPTTFLHLQGDPGYLFDHLKGGKTTEFPHWGIALNALTLLLTCAVYNSRPWAQKLFRRFLSHTLPQASWWIMFLYVEA